MRILVDASMSDVLFSASVSDTPTYLCYVLYDNFSYVMIKPLLFHSMDVVKGCFADGIEDFHFVVKLPSHSNPNTVKMILAAHYHYQLFGNTYKGYNPHKNLFNLKLDV